MLGHFQRNHPKIAMSWCAVAALLAAIVAPALRNPCARPATFASTHRSGTNCRNPGGECVSVVVYEERQVTHRGRANDLLQHRQDRQLKPNRFAVAPSNCANARNFRGTPLSRDVLFAESRDIGSALTEEQQQREGESCLGPDGVAFLELGDCLHCPGVILREAGDAANDNNEKAGKQRLT